MSDVTHLATEATQKTNVTGQMTPILEYDPEEGTALQIRNAVGKGKEIGVPFYLDLRDGANNPLPDDTEVMLRVDKPEEDQPVQVSEKLRNIAGWNALSMTEQRNEENIDATKVELEGQVITVRHFDTLRVDADSSAQIDWTNSEAYLDSKATRTIPMEG